MTRVIMHGCNGRMGQVISGLAAEDGEVQLVGMSLMTDIIHILSFQISRTVAWRQTVS